MSVRPPPPFEGACSDLSVRGGEGEEGGRSARSSRLLEASSRCKASQLIVRVVGWRHAIVAACPLFPRFRKSVVEERIGQACVMVGVGACLHHVEGGRDQRG